MPQKFEKKSQLLSENLSIFSISFHRAFQPKRMQKKGQTGGFSTRRSLQNFAEMG